EGLDECAHVRLEPPWPTGCGQVADLLFREVLDVGRDAPTGRGRYELVGRTAGRDNDRLTAGHRLQDRQSKPLAAIRMDEGAAGCIKPREVSLGQVFSEGDDLGRI